MKPASLRFGTLVALAAAVVSPLNANNEWWVTCKKKCASCEQGECGADDSTYGFKMTSESQPTEQDVEAVDPECSIESIVPYDNQSNGIGDGPGITELNYKREGIVFEGAGPGHVKYEVVGGIRKPRQMAALHTVLDYTDTPDGKGYQIAEYLTSQLPAPGGNGIRTIPSNAQPIRLTIFRNPNGDANTNPGTLDVVERQRHPQSGVWVTRTIRAICPQGNNTWERKWYLGDPVENPTLVPYKTVDVTRTPQVDGTETVRETTREAATNGDLVIQSDRTGIYGFYKYGSPALLSETNHTGTGSDLTTTWTYYTNRSDQASFNKAATLRRNDGQWANYTYQGNPVTGVLVTKTVSGWLDNVAPAVGSPADENANRVTVEIEASHETGTFGREEKIAGVLVSKSWGERYKDNAGQLVEKSRVETGSSTLLTIRTGYPTDASIPEAERGRLKSVEYPDGTIALHRYALQGANRVETVETGAGSAAGVTAGRRVVSTYTSDDTLIKEVESDIATGAELSAKEVIAFDSTGKPTRWAYDNNPDDYSETLYGCCGIDSTRSREGIVTTYTRDALKRPLTEVSLGITTTYTYGKKTLGGVDFPKVSVAKSGGVLTQDLGAGVRDHAGSELERISPDLDGDNNPEVTGIVRDVTGRTTTTTHSDGGTIVETWYADGRSKSRSGTAVAPEAWAYATHGVQGGGLLMTVYAGTTSSPRWIRSYSNLVGNTLKLAQPGGGGEVVVQTNGYDTAGRLVATADGDGVTTLFAYDAEGGLYRTAIDLNQNNQIDAADRITDRLEDVVTGSAIGTARRTRKVIYDLSNNPLTVSTSLISTDGLVIRTESLNGGVTLANTASWIDRSDGAWSRSIAGPDGTKSVTTYAGWFPVNSSTLDTTDSVMESTTMTYDALGRLVAQNDSRRATVTSRLAYGGGGLVSSVVEDLAAGPDRVTSLSYDSMGRRISVTLPDSGVIHTSHWPTGMEKASWGGQTYPVVKLYSPQGEVVELRTWRSNPPSTPDETSTGFDKTVWTYDDRGRLIAKTDADNQGRSYTYTPGGRLHTRTWARGTATTYGYTTAGELASADYSDTTPDVSITMDKLGRQTLVSNGTARTTFGYDPATLRLATETTEYDLDGSAGYEFSRVLNRSGDSIGRESGWVLKDGATVEHQAAYTRSATTGRLVTVGNPEMGDFTYSYVSGSALIASVAGPAHTVSNTWFADRDALQKRENRVGSTGISTFEYQLDTTGQRVGTIQSGTAFGSARTVALDYDGYGQVMSVDSTDDAADRVYRYDAIGNRTKAAEGLSLPVADNYVAGSTGRYSSIDGLSLSHDADGNPTSSPLPVDPATNGILEWDAENRLVSVEVDGAVTRFAYDAQNRVVGRMTASGSELFVYDKWNCIARYSGSSLAKKYLWGLDVSGGMQGAGGVGGLLAVGFGSGIYFPTYDGNGNVSEYLTGAGSVAAHWEYDAFGRAVVDSDTAHVFDIRFSTKMQDPGSGLYYYGYRFLDPNSGRWLNRDPMGEEGGIHLYAFVGNDPANEIDVIGLKLQINDIKYVTSDSEEAARMAQQPGADATWLGSTTRGTPKGKKQNKVESIPDPADSKKCCVEIQESIEYDITIDTTIIKGLENIVYTSNGFNAIVQHEERRRSVYPKAYDAYLKVFEGDILKKCKQCGMNKLQTRSCKEKIKKWLEDEQKTALQEFDDYVTTEQDAISAENDSVLKLLTVGEHYPIPDLWLIYGIGSIHTVQTPKAHQAKDCPKCP